MTEAGPTGSIPSALMAQAARRYGPQVALRFGERTWTFAQFDAAVSRLATALAARLSPGDRVALFTANCAEYLLLQCAVERAGLVRVPVNARSTTHELDAILADCEPGVLFYDSATADRIEGSKTSGLWCANVDTQDAINGPSFAGLADTRADPGRLNRAALDDLASINYTSGTSGRPKGAMLTHRNWAALYRNMLIDRDIRGDDIIAHVGPLTHSSGTYFVPWFLRGGTSLVVDGGTVDKLLAAIDRHNVTVFTCVPTVLTRIVNHPGLENFDLSSLRMIGYGAEPIPRNTLEKALAKFGPVLVQNYGQTEAMMTCTTLPAADHFAPGGGPLRVGCIGRAYTFVEIVLRAPDGQPVAPGEIGEITVRSDHVMHGYWRLPEETAKVLRDGFLWTGDLARMDETGLITLAGRSKEMLITGGHNIYPQEVEAALTSCPGVLEAAVIGVPDPDWGEIAIAFVSVVADSGLGADSVTAAVKPRLGIKTPKRIEILASLPKTGNGKVDKKLLRQRFADGSVA
ncbi:MAG: AMP-binding protein [Pseudolabrys sp.]|nr:AMP-binding protein [Pseudolabrys sp.]